MTKEELENKAKKYAIKSYGNDDWTQAHIEDMEIDYIRKCIAQAYLAGAEPREKRIAELEAQIEKMKCCGNCEHATHDSMNGTFCNYYSEWEHADLKCTQWELRR